ncbi:ABC transporter permease [Cellulomonas chitinilytica]|uniref:ABC transporter permease n=1 Tax=Cellulomonas chitinilytica TaxID=398759 RepID=A0A919P3X2_9CELL|nr:FtsX-like permease family protein [Cellulomonas chitinilytica]GIG22887.1 ABC transporter permease [Cellulomonas chitinilytica]
MLQLTLAQMRRSAGRLVAAAIAIAIGTAFLTTTLLAGGVITRTGYDAVTATFGDADLVATGTLTDSSLAAVRDTPGVDAADPLYVGGVELHKGGARVWQNLLPVPSDERLASLTVSSGAMPSASGEIALPAKTAERLRVAVGDTLTTDYFTPKADRPTAEETLTVVGIVDDPRGAWAQYGGAGLGLIDDLAHWNGVSFDELGANTLLVATDGDAADVRAALAGTAPTLDVLTKDEAAAKAVSEVSGEGNVLLTIVLGFAAVALLVAALVISNTFQVLVAQRVRLLALLRCVGAEKRQLRRSVLLEASILGAAASLVGLVTGAALAQAALSVLGRMTDGVPLPRSVDVTVTVVVVPLVVGTLVTLLASLVPARAATRVPPVAALRPVDAPTVTARTGKVRLAVSAVLTAGGVAGLLLTVAASRAVSGSELALLGVGILAGTVSFVGILLGAVFWVPRVVSLAGRLLAATGTSARIAAANTVRNPRRTAATSTALLIGVTLVVMMSTGAASARESLAKDLADQYPVDLTVEQTDGRTGLLDGTIATISEVPGVDEVVPVPVALAQVGDRVFRLVAPDPEQAARVLRSAGSLDDLTDGTVLLPKQSGGDLGTVAVHELSAETGDPAPDGVSLDLATVATDLGGQDALVTPSTLARVAPDAVPVVLWVRLDDSADPTRVLQDVRDAVPESPVSVVSAAAQRHSYERLISSLLAVVVGLLAVAVVIALVGVANTLSLSVIERRRESATLRAIGLTRRQLRWMLAVEGMLIAVVGAVLGVLLGLLYGWAGAATAFGQTADLRLAVPWRDLALVLLVALLAGLVASVLPARAAARTSPVAALAVD